MADIYVSALATGGGAGTIGDPFTLAEAITDLNLGAGSIVSQGENVWVKNDGVYQISASLDVTAYPDGAANSDAVLNIKFRGYNTTPGDNSPGSHTKVTIQATAAIQMVVFTAAHCYEFWYFCFDGNSIATNGINSSVHLYYFEIKGCTSVGLKSCNYASFGRIHHCHRGSEGGRTYGVMCDNNTEWGFYTGIHHFFICAYNANGSYLSALHNGIIDHNANNSMQTQWSALCNNVTISNQGPGTSAAVVFLFGTRIGRAHYFNFNFFNNAGVDCNAIGAITNPTYLDPQFKDPANLDYRITGSNLKNTGLLWINEIDYGLNIGVDQEVPTYALVTDVRTGVDRGDGAIGTLDLPSVNDVQEGVTFDGATKTGVFVSPAEGNVKNGITYGASAEFTGSYNEDYPTVNNVRDGIVYGNLSYEGTLELPLQANVKNGITYGAGGTEFTGIYVPDYPSISNVRTGTVYAESTLTGTLDIPSESDVRLGILYGAGGTEYTGSLDLPAESNVRLGTQFDNLTKTGTVVLPATTNVRLSSQYGSGGTEYTGGLDLPAETNVRDGIKYDSETKEGSLELPDVSDVRLGVVYGASGTELTGELIVGITVREDMVLNFNNDPVKIFLEVK